MKAANGYDEEPALINELLEVRSGGFSGSGETPLWKLAYENLSPEERGRYLNWLADGRPPESMVDSWGLLFLAGIERRYFSTGVHQNENLGDALDEVRRLAESAPSGSKAAAQMRQFLFAAVSDLVTVPTPLDATVLEELEEGILPNSLRLRLALRTGSGTPLNAVEALIAVASDAETYPRTPFFRCTKEVFTLFRASFDKQYRDGIKAVSSKEPFDFRYRPANHGMYELRSTYVHAFEFRIAPQTLKKLREFLSEATDALDAYSRRLASRPSERELFPTVALLPTQLSASHPAMQAVAACASVALEGGGRLQLQEIAPLWSSWPTERSLSRQERELSHSRACTRWVRE